MRQKDSRGRESTTLGFVVVAFWLVTLKYAFSGIAYADGKLSVSLSFAGAGEYGAAVALILAIWLGREWQEKRTPPPQN